jgi:hypothetical protein
MEESWLQNRRINDKLKELSPDEAATFQNIGIGATICRRLVKEAGSRL